MRSISLALLSLIFLGCHNAELAEYEAECARNAELARSIEADMEEAKVLSILGQPLANEEIDLAGLGKMNMLLWNGVGIELIDGKVKQVVVKTSEGMTDLIEISPTPVTLNFENEKTEAE